MKYKCIGHWHEYNDRDGHACWFHKPCGWEGDEEQLEWLAPKPNNILVNGDERCCPGCRGNVELAVGAPPRVYGPGRTTYT